MILVAASQVREGQEEQEKEAQEDQAQEAQKDQEAGHSRAFDEEAL